MAEGVAEVKQRTLSGLAFVASHDVRLGAAARHDRVFARRSSRKHLSPILFEPTEQGGIAEKSVFDDFGIAGTKMARG